MRFWKNSKTCAINVLKTTLGTFNTEVHSKGLNLEIGILVRILLKYRYFSWIALTLKQTNFDSGALFIVNKIF